MMEIRKVTNAADRRAWLALPHRLFADDPAWIAPLEIAERKRLSPKAPIRGFGEVVLFLALRDGEAVGRISAQVNRRHLAEHGDDTGHFGFFDCADDAAAAQALIEAAAAWLKARGMTRMAGPFNFTINEECGCLVENFTDPPVVMMPHASTHTGGLLERCGLDQVMDLYSYRCTADVIPRLQGLAAPARRFKRTRIRTLDLGHYYAEVRLLVDIFNDSWRGNWGFVPLGEKEAKHMASELRPVLRADYGRVLLLDEEPVGIMVAIPDINGMTADFGSRLLPFNWAKLAFRLLGRRERGARVLLLGLRQKVQSSPLAGALLALLVSDLIAKGSLSRLDWVDFSWILQSNPRMNSFARAIAGAPYKTHRLYARRLA